MVVLVWLWWDRFHTPLTAFGRTNIIIGVSNYLKISHQNKSKFMYPMETLFTKTSNGLHIGAHFVAGVSAIK